MSALSIPIIGNGISKTFHRKTGEVVKALDDVALEARHATLTALVGPDGAGKTTLIRLAAGLIAPDAGTLDVLGIDVAAHPQEVQDQIGYMPQKFGLYEDLSVRENLDLYAELHGVTEAARRERYPRLMEMTALGPFQSRLAGQLSGGMKQKLGLACALVRSPELLLLDEPTVGVDPLSRRELWEIILHLVSDQGLSVLLSTSYLDEAERCGHVVVLHEGKVLAQGAPSEITAVARGRTFLAKPPAGQGARSVQARLLDDPAVIDAVPEAGRVRFVQAQAASGEVPSGAAATPLAEHGSTQALHAGNGASLLADLDSAPIEPRFEDGFMVLLRRAVAHQNAAAIVLDQPGAAENGHVVVEVRDLVRQFGAFTAVDHVSFEVARGELFGLLGPNGAGKTTTFRMLCGLLPASAGTLHVAGVDLRFARATARQRIGYVAQKFSLYGQLTVLENLDFFASAYGLRGSRKRRRLDWAMAQFELAALGQLPAGQLPGGYKQRLAMAAALLHEPDILFLDEPTSGADPLARREFWRRITALAEQGVTVIITTHFMEEAEYCDRVLIMDAGRLLAQGTPAEIRTLAPAGTGREPSMEDAFIAVVQQARRAAQHPDLGHLAHDRP
jgi:pyoluteorin transport system ATP-binding protein